MKDLLHKELLKKVCLVACLTGAQFSCDRESVSTGTASSESATPEDPYKANDPQFFSSSKWIDKVIKAGMPISEVKQSFGENPLITKTAKGYSLEYMFEEPGRGFVNGDLVSVSIYFVDDKVIEWIPTTFGGSTK